jgi:hypothetical protein
VINTQPGWIGIFPEDWISWIAFRDGPVAKEYIILWVQHAILTGETSPNEQH